MPTVRTQVILGDITCCYDKNEPGVTKEKCRQEGHRNFLCKSCNILVPRVEVLQMSLEDIAKQVELDSPEEVFIKRAQKRGLFESIEKHGIRNPIILDKNCFKNGQHRFVVAKTLGLKTAPVIQR